MISNNLFFQENLLERTLQAYSLRAEVIQNNLANNDTPNFKKSGVEFEAALKNALDNGFRNVNLDSIKPTVTKIDKNFTGRIDKNNVDIEEESLKHYQNSVRFDAMMNAVTFNFKLLNTAITGR